MNMLSGLTPHYPSIKVFHLLCVAVSVAVFSARLLAAWAGAAWPMHRAVRRLSVGVDVLLLCAGATLWAVLQLHPLRDTWLGVKLLLLVAYIVLGSLALKRAPSLRAKVLCGLGAWLCVAAMVLTARAHHVVFWGV